MKYLFVILMGILTFAPEANAKIRPRLGGVQIGAVRYRPANWESSTTIQFGYSPLVDFGYFAARAELGIAWPRDDYKTRFTSLNYEAFVMAPVYSFLNIEVGGGLQSWRYEGMTTRPVLSVGLVLRVAEFIDRVYMGYSRYFLEDAPSDQIRSGVAINVF